MDIKSTLVGAGAVVLLAGGVFGAAAYANDAIDPASVVIEPTVKVEKETPPVVVVPEPVVTPEPEPVVVPEPAPVVVVPEPVLVPIPAEVVDVPLPEGGIPAPAVDPYSNPTNIQPTPPSADIDQP